MGFDEAKVQFNGEELDAMEDADKLYELFVEVMDDGLDLSDITAIPAAVPHIMGLYSFLANGTKADYAKKLIALGVGLLRDNQWLDEWDDEEG